MCDAGACHPPCPPPPPAPTSLGRAAQRWPLCGAQSRSRAPRQSPFLRAPAQSSLTEPIQRAEGLKGRPLSLPQWTRELGCTALLP